MDENMLKDRVHSLEQRLLQKGRELYHLKEMSLFLTTSVQKTVDLLAYRMGLLSNAKFVRIFLLDRAATKLSLVAGYNLSEKYLEMVKNRLEVSVETVPCGRAVRDKVPYIVNDINTDDAFAMWRNITTEHGYSSYIAMPLIVSERVLGVADIFFEDIRYFSDDEINLISVISNAGSLAIENAMLIEKIEYTSIKDEQTGAYNHRHFMETFKREIERAKRYNYTMSIIMMRIADIAGTEGHSGSHGDYPESVRQFVTSLLKRVRGCDMLFKYSNNAFCLILPHTPKKASAEFVITRIYEVFNEIFGRDMDINIGVSGLPDDGNDAEALINKALA